MILTGESKTKSNVEYIGKACEIARKYFKVVGLEVYPMNSDEYAYLHKCGADYVTVFQETYNSDKYETLLLPVASPDCEMVFLHTHSGKIAHTAKLLLAFSY